jgi:putative ABC transport system permease protein
MKSVALKMLIGDRSKYLGIVMGLTFASLLITQQSAMFVGLMSRPYGSITDTGQADIWVMDPKVQFIDDIEPLQDPELFRVVERVEWAVPLYKGLLKARLVDGTFQTCIVVGLDDATLIGGPPAMIAGELAALRRSDGIIVDVVGAEGKLAKPALLAGQPPIPLAIGDSLELNDHRAGVVGLASVSRTFQSQPVIYTTYARATTFAPRERKLLSFILVKAKPAEDHHALAARITQATGLAAYRGAEFKQLAIDYFRQNTGLPINFGIAVGLGFLVGTAIVGQTFYNFTLDHLRHFGALKTMGASNRMLLGMIVLQALMVGSIGYGIGVGAASLFGYLLRNTELSFLLPGQLLVFSAGAITLVCMFAALISIRKVISLEPAIVFKG